MFLPIPSLAAMESVLNELQTTPQQVYTILKLQQKVKGIV